MTRYANRDVPRSRANACASSIVTAIGAGNYTQ